MRARRSSDSTRRRFHAALIAPLVAGAAIVPPAQSTAVLAVKDALHVTAPGFNFIKGEALTRLKDGRSVRVDLELVVLARPRSTAAAQSRQTFILSYDLWEERFAVTHAGTSSQSVSHLTSTAAEAWCVQRLSVPVSALGRLGRDDPFWIRLESRIQEMADRSEVDDSNVFSLRGLIDALSRRTPASDATQSIEAGPFRLPQ